MAAATAPCLLVGFRPFDRIGRCPAKGLDGTYAFLQLRMCLAITDRPLGALRVDHSCKRRDKVRRDDILVRDDIGNWILEIELQTLEQVRACVKNWVESFDPLGRRRGGVRRAGYRGQVGHFAEDTRQGRDLCRVRDPHGVGDLCDKLPRIRIFWLQVGHTQKKASSIDI